MNKLALAVLFVGGLGVGGCDTGGREADNSARNVADRKDAAVTSGDQSNAKSDLEITQKIRRSVVADDSLSTNAQNVKIITAQGVVTLRGPVANVEEKAKIESTAQRVAGVKRVDNQIEIAN
jgi:osmotically-inducible protein OsmY